MLEYLNVSLHQHRYHILLKFLNMLHICNYMADKYQSHRHSSLLDNYKMNRLEIDTEYYNNQYNL